MQMPHISHATTWQPSVRSQMAPNGYAPQKNVTYPCTAPCQNGNEG